MRSWDVLPISGCTCSLGGWYHILGFLARRRAKLYGRCIRVFMTCNQHLRLVLQRVISSVPDSCLVTLFSFPLRRRIHEAAFSLVPSSDVSFPGFPISILASASECGTPEPWKEGLSSEGFDRNLSSSEGLDPTPPISPPGGGTTCDPADFKDRIIFMSMFNDIVWDAKRNEE